MATRGPKSNKDVYLKRRDIDMSDLPEKLQWYYQYKNSEVPIPAEDKAIIEDLANAALKATMLERQKKTGRRAQKMQHEANTKNIGLLLEALEKKGYTWMAGHNGILHNLITPQGLQVVSTRIIKKILSDKNFHDQLVDHMADMSLREEKKAVTFAYSGAAASAAAVAAPDNANVQEDRPRPQ